MSSSDVRYLADLRGSVAGNRAAICVAQADRMLWRRDSTEIATASRLDYRQDARISRDCESWCWSRV